MKGNLTKQFGKKRAGVCLGGVLTQALEPVVPMPYRRSPVAATFPSATSCILDTNGRTPSSSLRRSSSRCSTFDLWRPRPKISCTARTPRIGPWPGNRNWDHQRREAVADALWNLRTVLLASRIALVSVRSSLCFIGFGRGLCCFYPVHATYCVVSFLFRCLGHPFGTDSSERPSRPSSGADTRGCSNPAHEVYPAITFSCLDAV